MAGTGRGTIKSQQITNKLKGFDEDDLMMGVMLSQKPGIDLIQNCDLPPPMKVFSGSDNKTVISCMNSRKTCSFNNHEDIEDEGDGKLGLLRALRLSQTRAREAEAKFAEVSKERDLLVVAYMEDSMQLFAYRQLVRLLEIQVSKLQQQQKQKEVCCNCVQIEESEEAEAPDGVSGISGFTWTMALAFCFGVAGFGFAALGCKYYRF